MEHRTTETSTARAGSTTVTDRPRRMSGWTVASWVLAVASVFFGLFTAIAGAICGLVGQNRGDARARSATIANVVVGVLSVVFAVVLFA